MLDCVLGNALENPLCKNHGTETNSETGSNSKLIFKFWHENLVKHALKLRNHDQRDFHLPV